MLLTVSPLSLPGAGGGWFCGGRGGGRGELQVVT